MKKSYPRSIAAFTLLGIALALLVIWNISAGSVSMSAGEIARILFHPSAQMKSSTNYTIVRSLRLPRILAAVILGGALSVSGFLLQTFFGNPIAGPFVLGISSGAKMVVALTMIYFLDHFNRVSSWTLIVAAFIGSLLSVGFILLLSRRLKHMAVLLVAGIMIGYICSAVTTPSQLMPEKLPSDQPWRLTMSESSAKVMMKSVTAEQM